MKLYKAKNSKTGKYISFDGEPLVCNSIEAFGYLIRLYNKKEDDFETEEVSDNSPWHTGTPTEKGWYVCKIKGLDFMYETQYFTGSNWVEEHFEKWRKLEED